VAQFLQIFINLLTCRYRKGLQKFTSARTPATDTSWKHSGQGSGVEGQRILRAPPAPPLDVPCKITSKSNQGLLQYFIYSQCKKYSDITHSTLHGRSITSARILKQWKFIANLLRWNLLLQFPLHIERLEHELNLHNSTAIGNIDTVSLVLICPLELQSSNHWQYKWFSIPCEVCRGCWIHVLCV